MLHFLSGMKMHDCRMRCVELVARSVSRNKRSKMRVGKAADKVSVSGMIHCSTQGHDLDQGLVMEPAQKEREGEEREGARERVHIFEGDARTSSYRC